LREARGAGRDRPGLVWLGGFASDMRGAKASFVDAYAASQGRALLRFDYSGHGESAFDTPGGRFEDGAIGDWLEQSLSLFEVSTRGPQILIGTSMGAWIALLLARRLNEIRLRDRLRALLLLAPAVDFTEELLWKMLPAAARRLIAEKGVYARPSPYGGPPTPITAAWWRRVAPTFCLAVRCAPMRRRTSFRESWTRTCLGVMHWPSRIAWWTTR